MIPQVSLKEIAPAKAARLSFKPDEEVWQLNLDQIESHSGRVLNKVTGLASTAGSSTQAFDSGNVLYSKLRPYLNKVVCPESSGIATTELVPLRPNPEKLEREYLAHYLRSPLFLNWVSNEVAGAKMPRVSMKVFWGHKIPLQPLSEQKRIAGILDAADRLRAQRREALAQLDTLLQSTFLDLFGDPVTNPKGWEVDPMPEAVEGKYGVKAGPFGSALKKEDYTTSGYRIYGQEQVIAGRFDIGDYYIDQMKFEKLKACEVKTDDILVSLVGSYGKVLIVPSGIEPGIINPRLLKITPKQSKVTSLFLAKFIQNEATQLKLASMSHGGTMGILNAGLLKQLSVPLPPLPLQQRFAAIVEQVESQKARMRAQLTELDTLFAALQQRAFNGEF